MTETSDRLALNRSPGRRIKREPVDEAVHFIVCAACGQAIDCRNLGDVFHHEEPDHKPIGLLS